MIFYSLRRFGIYVLETNRKRRLNHIFFFINVVYDINISLGYKK